MNRIGRILSHLQPSNTNHQVEAQSTGAVGTKSPDDVVIVSAVRTAIGRAKKGSFKDTHPGNLLAAVLKGVLEQTCIDSATVGDVCVGNCLAEGGFAAHARMAMLLADMPVSVPISTANRQCSSGLQSVAHVAAAISAGYYDIGIAAGVESMTKNKMSKAMGELNDEVFSHPVASTCLYGMGQTSENVANEFKISRLEQDTMAVDSHRKALAAVAAGKFTEIIPVTTKIVDKEGNEKEITVTKDDGPRPGSTIEKLGRLRPAFDENGTTTAGNSSQVSDGAAAVLLMRRSKAEELKLAVKGVFRTFSVVGVRPDVMGIGPAEAIPVALQRAGLSVGDVDVYEINEAFASQAVYCVNKLGIDMKKVNPLGGAIALGHPLGCTGARQVATLLPELHRNKSRFGVVSMCIGTGMGAACVIENEQL